MYTTQMDAAKKDYNKWNENCCKKKGRVLGNSKSYRKGRVIIPANKNHKSLDPEGIGKDLELR